MNRACSTCGREIVMATHIKTGKRAPLVQDDEGMFTIHDTGQGDPIYEHIGKGGGLLDEGVVRYKSHFADCQQADQHRRPR